MPPFWPGQENSFDNPPIDCDYSIQSDGRDIDLQYILDISHCAFLKLLFECIPCAR